MSGERLRPEAVARPGSPLYLGLLFANPDNRDALLAVAALRAELVRSARVPSEPAVAGARLQWWQEELRRLAEGRPGHPVSRSLLPLVESGRAGATDLERLLAAADRGSRGLDVLLEVMGSLAGYADPAREHDVRYSLREIGAVLDGLSDLGEESETGESSRKEVAGRLRARLRSAVSRLPAGEIRLQAPAVVMAGAADAMLSSLVRGRRAGRLASLAGLSRAWRIARLANRGRLPEPLKKEEG